MGSLLSRRIECMPSMHDWQSVTSERVDANFPHRGSFCGSAAITVKCGVRDPRMMGALRRKA
jgi:hypothetical protein